jgi:flagellar FliL protein
MAQDPKPDGKVKVPVSASRKKLISIIAAVLILAAVGGGVAWYFMHQKSGLNKGLKHEATVKAPIFVTMDTFTVNLHDPDEKFLQLDVSLQVASPEVAELLKVQMPAVRNRLLMLLTSKKSTEIFTMEGKKKLSDEIAAEVRKPFYVGAKSQEVSGVFFTAFVIQ